MKRIVVLAFVVLLNACTSEDKPLTEAEQATADSLSKVRQRRSSDSLKKLNPLLILPPDSNYTGEYEDKYPDGIIKYKGFFRFGERHGQWIAFYANGLPWSEHNYDKGKKFGPNIVYYENGKIRYSGFYKNDKRDSTWKFYDTLGNVLKTLVYKEDKEIKVIDAPRTTHTPTTKK